MNIILLPRLSTPVRPPSTVIPNQTWSVELTIVSFLMLTSPNKTPPLQAMAPFLNASSTDNFQTKKDIVSCPPIFKIETDC